MSWVPYVTMFLLALCGLLLIFIILLQRGRGGGLAGALGGMGGQSAFGTKAGDVFTKITVVLAIIWVVLAAGNVYALRGFGGPKFKGGSNAVPTAPELESGDKKPGDEPNMPIGGAGTDSTNTDELKTDTPKSDEPKPDNTEPKTDDAKAAPEATEPPAAKTESPETPAEKSEKTPE